MQHRESVRLGERERAVIDDIVDALDVTRSEAIRLAINALDGHDVPMRDSPDVRALAEAVDRCTAHISRVGSNINQIARRCNIDGVSGDVVAQIRSCRVLLDKLADDIRGEVGHVNE